MKKILLMVLVAAALIGCGGNVTQPQSSGPRTGTVFVGDSIFGRWDLDSYFPGKHYVNAGWFGQRTDQILAVFPAILDGSNVCHGYSPVAPNPPDPAFPFSCGSIAPPERVVILLGWNDLFQAKSSTAAAANIRAMAKQAQAAGVRVVFVVPYRFDSAHPASWMQPWNSCNWGPFSADEEPVLDSGIRAAAAEMHAPLVDLDALFVCQSDYTLDGVHPNASGYGQMRDAFLPLL